MLMQYLSIVNHGTFAVVAAMCYYCCLYMVVFMCTRVCI